MKKVKENIRNVEEEEEEEEEMEKKTVVFVA
jgi:hypothetical protein